MPTYHDVTRPTKRHIGDKVVGLRSILNPDYKDPFTTPGRKYSRNKEFPGVLIKNEISTDGVYVNPRYTIKCDDGKIRRFQKLKK